MRTAVGWGLRNAGRGLSVLSLLGLPALGQLSTDMPPRERTLPVAEQVSREMATARFRLGPVRLAPFFTLSNIGWTNNALVTSEGTVDDFTASASAGTRLILPVGPKVFLRGVLAPTYDWYFETVDLRGFGGRYSGELLGLFNRLTVGAGGGFEERISTVSSEVARDVSNTTSSGEAKFELALLDRLSVFGGAAGARLKQQDAGANTPGLAPVSDLDRAETAVRVGLRYAFSSTISLGLMGEEVATRFDANGELRDNDVTGLLLVARYERERFFVEGTAGPREGRAVTPNDYFPEYREWTYGYFASSSLGRALELSVRGSRRPVSSLFLDNPYYFETRNEVSVRFALGHRVGLRVFGGLGSNRYVNPVLVVATGEILTRVDDTTRTGGGIELRLSRSFSFTLQGTQERFDSNIDYYDRDVFRIYGGLAVSASFAREQERR